MKPNEDQAYWEQLAMEIDLANNLFVPPEDYEPNYLDNQEKEDSE